MTPAASITIKDLETSQLHIREWTLHQNECWVILGRNGSGKQYFSQLLMEGTGIKQGSCSHNFERIELLSFEAQQTWYEQQLHEDNSEFMEGPDHGTTVRELLQIGDHLPDYLHFLNLAPILDRGYRLLSSGEARKALLAQALLKQPDLLILDEPFDSLDVNMRQQLSEFLHRLSRHTTLLFLLNTTEDIFPWHSHMAVLERGQMVAQGDSSILENAQLQSLLRFDPALLPPWPAPLHAATPVNPLVKLKNGTVKYGSTEIFSGIDLEINQGDHTLITGANGSGKSTLLGLITGDHTQCYGNELSLFGQLRGTGETIWELKRHFGMVTPGLHRDHRVPGSALEIVVSGFFDSIGLYAAPSSIQIEHARIWLALAGLQAQASTPYKQLSYGEQRLALIARAMVKQPPLLILDEPTQGLDDINRHRVLHFLDHLASQKLSTIIMASHRQDEFLPLFTRHLHIGS